MPDTTESISPLKRRRLAAGLTQGQLAERLGVTLQAVYLWERGDSIPSPRMYPRLSEALGITAMEATELFRPSAPAAE